MVYSNETLNQIIDLQKYISENRGVGLLYDALEKEEISENQAERLEEKLCDWLDENLPNDMTYQSNDYDFFIEGAGWLGYDDDGFENSLAEYLEEELGLVDEEVSSWLRNFKAYYDNVLEDFEITTNEQIRLLINDNVIDEFLMEISNVTILGYDGEITNYLCTVGMEGYSEYEGCSSYMSCDIKSNVIVSDGKIHVEFVEDSNWDSEYIGGELNNFNQAKFVKNFENNFASFLNNNEKEIPVSDVEIYKLFYYGIPLSENTIQYGGHIYWFKNITFTKDCWIDQKTGDFYQERENKEVRKAISNNLYVKCHVRTLWMDRRDVIRIK
ncbi:TPA: hypothetical protein ACG6RF_002057 [Streptococcus agalactiae]|nr:hypothetical protein [Streptococcus agalactiae]HEO2267434.1 hypothetical protein [Streptococcus agalactiae]HEO7770436.1 hypothetical protein [Streptococcus agalactiae]